LKEFAGIYFHIPFCISRCAYCDFFSQTLKDKLVFNSYLDALFNELEKKIALIDSNLISVYFGGGTPSLISTDFFLKISNFLKDRGVNLNNVEFTIEANPADLDENYLEFLKKSGVNRLSIGIQAFDDDILKLMGRRDRVSHISSVLQFVPKFFDNFSYDFIYGIGTNRNICKEFEQIFNIASPKHISAYSYMKPKNLKAPNLVDEDVLLKQEEAIFNFLKNQYFIKYEVSNFAKQGYESRHNLLYWQWGTFLGIGAGAHSFFSKKKIRGFYKNNIKSFIKKSEFIVENLSKKELVEDFLLMGLRLVDGFKKRDFFEVFQINFEDLFSFEFLNRLIEEKLILINNESVKTTKKGMNFLNNVLTDMFVELEKFNDW